LIRLSSNYFNCIHTHEEETMSAQIIKGAPIAAEIREELTKEIEGLVAKGHTPKLSVVLVGEDPGSVWYARNKVTTGEKMGAVVEVHELATDTPEADVVALVEKLNADTAVHGILVELPLPGHINKGNVMNAIAPAKDVDGVTAEQRGYVLGDMEALALVPATPLACIELIERAGVDIKGKKVTVIGRGDTVGRPLAMLLLSKGRDATVTVCHSRTADLPGECRSADILIAAAGAGADHLVKKADIKPGATIIDAAINEKADGSITGDVDPEAVEVAGVLTPVPGGVGSLTTTIIIKNTVKALKLQKGL
jgi:methylenetetrahydrofolate dehydrogenase (NADP+)/methenyltetrahydrofolate cyclohydrolase